MGQKLTTHPDGHMPSVSQMPAVVKATMNASAPPKQPPAGTHSGYRLPRL
jgi:hypothetical protein